MSELSADKINEVLDSVDPHVLSVSIINLDNVAENYAKMKSEVPDDTQVAATIKANAYGFGAVLVSRRLYAEGCRLFFVATIEEGVEIRQALKSDAQIFVLSGLLEKTEDIFTSYQLTPVLNNMYQADLWINHARKLKKKLETVIHVDTGMSRNGFSDEYISDYYPKFAENLDILFVMSHLACGDVLGHEMNQLQLNKFVRVLNKLGNPRGSLSATNGIFLGSEYCFDIVRPGKSLYGFSIREDKVGSMGPVMDVFARVVQINHLKTGDTVGYGATFAAEHDMKIISVGIGYADGFMRKFSGFGYGFLGGKKIPMVGRISMDYIVFDATDVDDLYVKIGDWVALTRSPDYTIEEWALELGTLPHEIACRFGSRVKKIYVGEV
jgi:alanine racemase